jgi:TRAP-type C4-dicarboxylate transport system substrate-binding protein
MRMANLLPALLLFLTVAPATTPAAAASANLELKIATLAPKNSAWAKSLEQGARQADEKTTGRLKLRFFFSGQQGDERDMVRKMTAGQLDGAVLTAVGLGLIVPEVRVLELPTLFKTTAELDAVRDAMTPAFEKLFAAKGYVLVSWGDVGWVHTFSTQKYDTVEKMRQAKAWVWTDDPVTRAMQKRLGLNGVPLGVPQVLSSLQTGQIDTCYASPLAAVALQWYTKIKYASADPLSYAIGGMVVRKDVFDRLSPEDQKAFLDNARANSKAIIAGIRKDNERAKKAMIKAGVEFVPAPEATIKTVTTAAEGVWKDLVGTLYDQKLLDEVLAQRQKVRGK